MRPKFSSMFGHYTAAIGPGSSSSATPFLYGSNNNSIFGCFKRYLRRKLVHRGGDHFSYGARPWLPKFQSEKNPEWNQAIVTNSPLTGYRKQIEEALEGRSSEVEKLAMDESLKTHEPYPRFYLRPKRYFGQMEGSQLLQQVDPEYSQSKCQDEIAIKDGQKSWRREEIDAALLMNQDYSHVSLNPLELAAANRLSISHYPSATIVQMFTDGSYLGGRVPSNDRLVFLGNAFLEMYLMQKNVDLAGNLDDFTVPDGSQALAIPKLYQIARELGLQHVIRFSPNGAWIDMDLTLESNQDIMAKSVLSVVGAIYHLEGPFVADAFIKKWIFEG